MKSRLLALGLSPVLLIACQSNPAQEPTPEIVVESETGGAQTHPIGSNRLKERPPRAWIEANGGGPAKMLQVDGRLVGPDGQALVGEFPLMFTNSTLSAGEGVKHSAGSLQVVTDENGYFEREIPLMSMSEMDEPLRFVFALLPGEGRPMFAPGGLYASPDEMLVAHHLHQPAPANLGEAAEPALHLEQLQFNQLEASLVVDACALEGPFTLKYFAGAEGGYEMPWEMVRTQVELAGGAEHVLYSLPGAEGWRLRVLSDAHGTLELERAEPGDTVVPTL
jgi:hypothetical protein